MERLISLLRWVWRFTALASICFTGCVLFIVVAVIFGAASLHRQATPTAVPDGAALVLAPRGSILEKKLPVNPAEELSGLFSNAPQRKELFLQDIISGLRAAAKDSRIKLLVILPDQLEQAGLNQLRDIGQAIAEFRAAGKQVIAAADNYSQGQYYLAAWSDEIYLHPMGEVGLTGFGLFSFYLRELLDKLEVTFHVFRVGEFKSAVEPFLRTDMSPEAKANGSRWLGRLWDSFSSDIAKQRRMTPQEFQNVVSRLAERLEAAGGDAALMAQQSRLVDGLKSDEELRGYLRGLVGGGEGDDDAGDFKQIDFSTYLNAVSSSPPSNKDRVAILTAQGDIVYGEGGENQIGSAALVRQLRKLRQDSQVKAVVLRIDSGGGSAFASELIRQELLLLRKAGKPVVVSMGSAAASGGYWIAAAADRIVASPYTITGSIGIFGLLPTFEKTLAKAGIYSDGIGTTELAGAGSVGRPLPENFRRAIQTQVEQGYRRFLDIVAEGRKMNREDVEKLAGGQVWDGAAAFELGLADQLGSLNDAVAAAAAMAGLPADQAAPVEEDFNPAEIFLRSLHSIRLAAAPSSLPFLSRLVREQEFLLPGDPQHLYSHCLLSKPQF
ncbi:MAG: signal peptide peptidase SppA [Candidatus Electronema sp. V4]|uniref:signal peptide peptidase SppA n=1 Tax=Candidatus Electronema sp. V4 TaxID=3454756 RepID=UPI00405557EF